MASEEGPKEFPDVSVKLAAPKKLSAFERGRQAAEEKRRRAEAENAAALKDFEDSFGGHDFGDDDRYDGFPRSSAPLAAPRAPRPSAGPGPPPPSLKRKRALDELREAQEARREQEAFAHEYIGRGDVLRERSSLSPTHDDEHEDIALRPTVQLSSLPLSTTANEVRALLREHLPVHSIRLIPPLFAAAMSGKGAGGAASAAATPGATTGRKSATAIVTLSLDTSTTQIDAAVSALKDKYLSNGFRLSISRHLSSASILQTNMPTAPIINSVEPFGAQKHSKDQQTGRFHLRNAPPPSDFIPADCYDAPARSESEWNATVAIQPPADIATIRAVHTMVDRLRSEKDPDRALAIEAMLMSLPEVQKDARFSFLYDSRSPTGVYYRYLLWNDDDSYEVDQERKRMARGPERIVDDIVIDWVPPSEKVPFADLSKLSEVIDHIDYESSDEESDDGVDAGERQFHRSRREGDGPLQLAERTHLTPLQVAKFAWLLSRTPSSHSKLRKGDVAAITSFAINHAGAGAEEIVDMLVLNVEKPYTRTSCAKFDDGDVFPDGDEYHHEGEEEDTYEPHEDLPVLDSGPPPDLGTSRGDGKEAEDPAASKLVALYLINDILHNSSTAGVRNAWKYRQLFENAFKRHKVFERLGRLDKELEWGRMRMDKWRRQISVLFEIWEHGSVFASDVFEALKQNFFDQLVQAEEGGEAGSTTDDGKNSEDKWMGRFRRVEGTTASPRSSASPVRPVVSTPHAAVEPENANIDHAPTGDDLDGVPMEDLDGAPMDDLDGDPMEDLDDTSTTPAVITDSLAPENIPTTELAVRDTQAEFLPNATNSVLSPSAGAPKRRKLAEDMFADSDEE